MSLTSVILLALKLSIVISVFVIGLKATIDDATYLFRRPGHLARALLSMFIVMPVLAVFLALVFNLHPAVKIALVALSVCPTPPILPNKALKAGGLRNYTIGLLTATALLSILIVPISMEIFQRIGGIPLRVTAVSVASQVLASILIPLILGIIVRAFLPAVADKAARPLSLLATVLLILCLLPVLIGSVRTILSLFGDGTLISLAVFALVGFISGHLLGGPEQENRPVLALATSTRHPAIAIGIAHANFPDEKLTIPAVLLYLILSAILSAPYLSWAKRSQVGSGSEKQVSA